MGLDTLLKRYFAVVVLALIGLAAYFQASGVTQFAGSRLAVDAKALAAAAPASPASAQPTTKLTFHATNGDPILSRNPFDSVTGPLNRPEESPDDEPSGPVDLSNPYGAPPCQDDTRVLVIAASEDPSWSMAALKGASSEGKTQMRRIGDDFGSKRVWYIAWDRLWLQGSGDLCQVRMFHDKPKAMAKTGPAPAKSAAPRPTKRSKKGPQKVPPEIAAKIQKVSPTEFNVDRSVVDTIMENQAALMRSARIVPEQKDGKVVGVRMFGIRSDTLLGTLGLENGDRLDTINGFSMGSPEKALEAYARLRTADHLTITVNRRGKPTNIDFNIK